MEPHNHCVELPEWCLVDGGEGDGEEEDKQDGSQRRRRELQKEVC